MTPLEPHGKNGGAGVVATALVRHLAVLAPDLEISLLTARASHAELASLDAPNVRRKCVVGKPAPRSPLSRLADRLLPAPTHVRLKHTYWSLRTSRKYARVAEDLGSVLLLCPFTIPHFWQAGVPCIAVVYDLQHLTYPEFFTPEQRLNRWRHIQDACARSDRVVCISDYVRSTLLASSDISPERVVTIRLGLLQEFRDAAGPSVERLGLRRGGYLVYPANFWPHKNHTMLLEALRIHRYAHPESQLKLVCTGAPNPLMDTLQGVAQELLPPGAVVFTGYVPEAALGTLLDACAAVIFPSLYEGFGMPVLEAMSHGKPVLCSDVTSLPEVAGDAAIYFDPKQPRQIASAIDALADVPRITDLVRRGRQRAAAMGTGRDMAERYLALMREVMAADPRETCSASQ
ncbi:MAG: glycosyltransferase family 4 protein [Chloroflexota bacterium]